MVSPQCFAKACAQGAWERFLTANGLGKLEAPPGGRAYRWMWFGTDPNGPLGLQAPQLGFVELIIDQSGVGRITSSWRRDPTKARSKQMRAFETAFSKTNFALLPSQTSVGCLDECQDQIMEAVIDDRYHYVARDGGINEGGVREAGLLLEAMARGR